ncbi:rRNA methyltransferase [Roseibium aquae]|uniref:rRNA methyltransferase n=1 Tax=Roseibium aquae TaxID=1323746 RepID=A0A916WXX9_9HYPH|nr:RNA methyltransferase [Roseibium aquae]GGB38352.1 rRNA methyltransferase [Roseibium aquae]
MRGYFAIGAEGLSKRMNLGTLMRSAHAFGASFFFTVDAAEKIRKAPPTDTSKSPGHLPLFSWDSVETMDLPRGCQVVGVELTDEAIDLPSFGHPLQAAYVLGPERGSLSEKMLARCDHVVKIPTKFCINVAMAGAVVMYDRHRAMGRYADRSLTAGGPQSDRPGHVHGGPIMRRGRIVPGTQNSGA